MIPTPWSVRCCNRSRTPSPPHELAQASAFTRLSPFPNVSLSNSIAILYLHGTSASGHLHLLCSHQTTRTLLRKQDLRWLLGSVNPSPKGPVAGYRGPYLMTLKVLCSKRAVGVGRPRAKACFRISMLRLQSSASFSNLPARRSCSGP